MKRFFVGALCLAVASPAFSRVYLDEPIIDETTRFNYHLRLDGQGVGVTDPTLDLNTVVLHRQSLKAEQAVQLTGLVTDLMLTDPVYGSLTKTRPTAFLQILKAAEVTGRLPVYDHDPDVLRLEPSKNPLLLIDDEVSVSKRSDSVLVFGEQQVCSVEFVPGALGKAYAEGCFGRTDWFDFGQVSDEAWLIQPNGEVHKLNMGVWNASSQPAAMPGAFVLVKKRTSALDRSLYERLALFLATQGSSIEIAEKLKAQGALANRPPLSVGGQPVKPRFMPRDNNDFGQVGIFQTPTARMHEAGTLGITFSKVNFYNRTAFSFQPLDWFEGTLRYTKVLNTNIAVGVTDEKFLDKGFDAKMRLVRESAYIPEISLGLVDVGGTGLFSGEYFVASKRYNNFDFSLGLGWGYYGRADDLNNPLARLLGDEYNSRNNRDFGLGGEVEFDQFFKGPVSIFGGLQWHSPFDGLVLKAEYEGNNYLTDFGGPYEQSSRLNFGLTYHFTNNVSLSVSQQRGEVLGFKLSLTPNLANERIPNVLDPIPVERIQDVRPKGEADWAQTVAQLEEQSKWSIGALKEQGSEVRLSVIGSGAAYESEAIEKASLVLNNTLPDKYKWFVVDYSLGGVYQAEVVVDRTAFENRVNNKTTADYTIRDSRAARMTNNPTVGSDPRPEQVALAPNANFSASGGRTLYEAEKSYYTDGFSLAYQQVFGGIDGILFQFYAAYTAQMSLSESTYIGGRLGYRVLDNYEKFDEVSQSALPPVRTKQKDYLTGEKGTLRNLSLVHTGQVEGSPHHYAAYVGYFEEMFGGVGGEYLYRPYGSNFALALDLNRVKQRDFDQRLSFIDYEVTTGHLTTYWDTGFQGLLGKVAIGQYLAGDVGATFDVSRQFNNGTVMGVFATKTNVSAEQFGEGSFDKGIYLRVPWDLMMPATISGDVSIEYHPLTRDGGAKLRRPIALYDLTQPKGGRLLKERGGARE